MITVGGVLAALAAPGTSFAGTVSSDGSNITYADTTGETNVVTVNLSAGTYTISDTGPGVAMTVNPPCALAGPTSATCPQAADPASDHVTVDGGDLNDTIAINAMPRNGTRIIGGAGDDTLTGSAGPDKITGGTGDDVIDPNDVSNVDMDFTNSLEPCDTEPIFLDINLLHCPDFIDGEQGYNTLRFDHKPNGVVISADARGPDGVSVIDPTRPQNGDVRNNLMVLGSRGNFRTARLIGTPGPDQIFGSANNDTLVGRGGADTLCGGLGNDTVDYSASASRVDVTLDTNLSPDAKWASSSPSDWSLARGDCRQTDARGVVQPTAEKDCVNNDGEAGENDCVGVDTENVIGSPFDDSLVGSSPGPFLDRAAFFEPRGMNVLDGRGGNDFLDGRLGADTLIGGDGTDTVSYASETLPVAVSLDGAANDGSTADLNPDTGLGDSVGTDIENIVGGSGGDTLGGSSAPNTIQGGEGDDILQGQGGDDTLDGGEGDDYLQGQDGNDQLQGSGGNDLLDGGFGADTFDGGDGSDGVDYSTATTPVFAAPDGAANDGRAGEGDNIASTVESLTGGSDADTLVGNDGDGILDGGPGNDTLDGGGGNDLIIGGAGFDNASYAARGGPVSVDLAAGVGGEGGEVDQLAQVENVTGGAGNDNLAGADDVNILAGGPGNDTLDGRGGPDQLFGGEGGDALLGGAGADTLAGEQGNDNLQGGDDADSLNGGEGDDALDGGAGADVLAGGPGNDTAMYASRSAAVDVTLDGANNDGAANEHDQVRLTTESVKTGSGNDTINAVDGVKGNVSCGAGTDAVSADKDDTVASDCEEKSISALSVCSVRTGLAKMSKKGVIRVRVSCPTTGKGKLSLRTVGRAKRASRLGSHSISLKAGKKKTVKIKLTKKAKRLLKRHKGSLRAHATISLKGKATAASKIRRSQNLTILAPRWRR